MIEVQVWNVKELSGIERKSALRAKCIPSIAINNAVVFESTIPPQDELIAAIRRCAIISDAV